MAFTIFIVYMLLVMTWPKVMAGVTILVLLWIIWRITSDVKR